MLTSKNRSIAAVGDVSSIKCWSGTPFHFWQAALKANFASLPWCPDLHKITWQRFAWNLAQGRKGGFQYSDWFLNLLEAQIPTSLKATDVITFNQHFPRSSSIKTAGGTISHYLDAPFAALSSGRGLNLSLPRKVVERALALERENYAESQRVVTMARWAADVMIEECGVPRGKVHTILPGANITLPDDWSFPVKPERAGRERDFVLGFVGSDWKRKGLPLMVSVRDELSRRGWKVRVLAAGVAPPELQNRTGVEFVGYIDKRRESGAFLDFLSKTDLGCLFSDREALGISTLEFLRAGVPVSGFVHEGTADTIPPDAGFRFQLGDSVAAVADRWETYLETENMQKLFRENARRWSPLLTWARCVREMQELWQTGKIEQPVRPWMGHNNNMP